MEPEILDHVEVKESEINSANNEVESSTNDAGLTRVGNSINSTNDFERSGASGVGGEDKKQPKEENGDHVIDINCSGHGNGEDLIEEKICRICLFSTEPSTGTSELIQLGCHCRAELGISHRHCAETWFKQRRNRLCEICGATAKNVGVMKMNTRILIVDFDDIRVPAAATPNASPREGSHLCKKSCCNFLLACLLLGLVLPFCFRGSIF